MPVRGQEDDIEHVVSLRPPVSHSRGNSQKDFHTTGGYQKGAAAHANNNTATETIETGAGKTKNATTTEDVKPSRAERKEGYHKGARRKNDKNEKQKMEGAVQMKTVTTTDVKPSRTKRKAGYHGGARRRNDKREKIAIGTAANTDTNPPSTERETLASAKTRQLARKGRVTPRHAKNAKSVDSSSSSAEEDEDCVPGATPVGGSGDTDVIDRDNESIEITSESSSRVGSNSKNAPLDVTESPFAADATAVATDDVESALGTDPVVAHLAPDVDEEVERRLKERLDHAVVVVDDVVAVVHVDGSDEVHADEDKDLRILGFPWIYVCIATAIGFVAIAAAVAGTVVAVFGGSETRAPSETFSSGSTASSPMPSGVDMSHTPSEAPSPSVVQFSPRFEELFELVATDVALNPDILRNTSSPQHWAMSWLADTDEANLNFNEASKPLLIERYALTLIYAETGGDTSWKANYGFLGSLPVCQWNIGDRGVFCTTSLSVYSMAKNLQLRGNGLEGTLPTEIGLLTTLTSLDVALNTIRGTVPTEIGMLTNLDDFVSFGANSISGTIPTEVGMLSKVADFLSFNDNKMHGRIPTEIGSLALLQRLWIRLNNFSGAIPSELGLMSGLTALAADTNNFSGQLPSEIGWLPFLNHVYLYDNPNLMGRVPIEYSSLSSLQEFRVQNTSLTGGFKEAFCDPWLFYLRSLDADCRGEDPEVKDCSCCTTCCDDFGCS